MTSLDSAGHSSWGSRLPPDFSYDIYVHHPRNQDVSAFDEAKAINHYLTHGRIEGRICSAVRCRKDFIGLIPPGNPILEIGPFFSPAFKKSEANVNYLDCLSTDAMQVRASTMKESVIEAIPEIDYVWTGEKYRDLVDRRFSAVYSSHNIEHQPCLVTHLRDIESVLQEDGAVFLVVPDKRYCFDHFFCESTVADVVDAWHETRTRHRLKDILDHRFFATHNDPLRHWRGDHGDNRALLPLATGQDIVFLGEIRRLLTSSDYTDVHAWKFTPDSFQNLFNDLYRLKLTTLRLIRLYSTVNNSNEFYVVLVPESGHS